MCDVCHSCLFTITTGILVCHFLGGKPIALLRNTNRGGKRISLESRKGICYRGSIRNNFVTIVSLGNPLSRYAKTNPPCLVITVCLYGVYHGRHGSSEQAIREPGVESERERKGRK